MYITFSFPTSYLNCLIDSKKGVDSISPTVPPISVITISELFSFPTISILDLISLVI